MELIAGVSLHFIGAFSASVCYTPQKGTRRWSWQTYWLLQAGVCWLLLPVVVAFISIPHLRQVLQEAPASAMRSAFLLGAAYGIGGTAFGMAIRYVGFSLTYAISVGISCVLGTLLPPLYEGRLSAILGGPGGNVIIAGMLAGAAGIALCGAAGRLKEKDYAGLRPEEKSSYSFSLGIGLCILSGILSALYGFSLAQGQPIADVAAKYGAGHLQGNVIYIFSNTGAFLTTGLYCLYLHARHKTLHEYGGTADRKWLGKNYLLAALTGVLWYTQFFFYGLGHNRMGNYKFTSWAIHMIMLVLISALVGIVMKEWAGTKKRTTSLLILALVVLIAAVLIITYGNYLGGT
ncbi:L-rhamnose/proton symporter RhaT [Chitinophaga sp.]|uniref:L-rhamnose/proton symporter RhaT n=1 Tax=Chitinophaga sp. TaxID=1869181 RepID=UPI0031DEDC25